MSETPPDSPADENAISFPERQFRSLPGALFFYTSKPFEVIAATGGTVVIPFKKQDEQMMADYDVLYRGIEDPNAIPIRLSSDRSFFILENGVWRRAEDETVNFLEHSLSENLALAVVPNPQNQFNRPEIFHLGLNPGRKEGWLPLPGGKPKDVAHLLAVAALSEIELTDDQLTKVRWISEIPGAGKLSNPSTVVKRISSYLADKWELRLERVLPTDLAGIYSHLKYNIRGVGVEGVVT